MNFISAALCGFQANLGKKLLFALIIINLLTALSPAQTNFTGTRKGGSPLSLLCSNSHRMACVDFANRGNTITAVFDSKPSF